jgi:hypothetical protein
VSEAFFFFGGAASEDTALFRGRIIRRQRRYTLWGPGYGGERGAREREREEAVFCGEFFVTAVQPWGKDAEESHKSFSLLVRCLGFLWNPRV